MSKLHENYIFNLNLLNKMEEINRQNKTYNLNNSKKGTEIWFTDFLWFF